MAKYTINHTCGHQVTIQLYGSNKDRERRIAYLETIECEECRKSRANAAAAEANAARGLADLAGTEKQVAWANTIRDNAYRCLDSLAPLATNEQAKAMMDGWRAKMDATTDAKWWIDNRYDIPNISEPQAARENVRKFNDLFKA